MKTSPPPGPGLCLLSYTFIICSAGFSLLQHYCVVKKEDSSFFSQVTLFGPRPSCDTQQRLVIVLKICEEVKSRDQVNESWAAQGKWQFSVFRKIDWD